MADISKMFEAYHKHLNIIKDLAITDRKDEYICPICLRGFRKHEINKLSLEDVPQKAVGGKKIAITCKECNNTQGNTIDYHLINFIDFIERRQFLIGSDRKIVIGELNDDNPINASIRVNDSNDIDLLIPNNYYKSKEYLERLNLMVKGKQLWAQDKPLKIDKRFVSTAIIKNAYITLFSKTGYTFLLDDYYDRLRLHIKDPESYSLPKGMWKPIRETNCADGVYMTKNNFLYGFFVIFTAYRIRNYRFITYIPSPSVTFEEAIESFRQIKTAEGLVLKRLDNEKLLWEEDELKKLRDWTYTLN